jgi:hypothetical protein
MSDQEAVVAEPQSQEVKPEKKVRKGAAKPAAPVNADGSAPEKKVREKKAPSDETVSRTDSYANKKITKLLASAEAANLRAGSKREAMLKAVYEAENTSEVLGKSVTATVKGETKEYKIAGDNLRTMVLRKFIEIEGVSVVKKEKEAVAEAAAE